MDCIFCKIIAGELPASIVYEDDEHIAFLDLFPVSKGHTLIIPKKHHVNIFDATPDMSAGVYTKLAKLANAIKEATGCDGINLVQNNGAAAGQIVFHSHIHLIPRYEGDTFIISPSGKTQADREMLDTVRLQIRKCLG